MIICKHCGQEISEKHIICPYCTKKQTDKVKKVKIKEDFKEKKTISEDTLIKVEPEVIVEQIYETDSNTSTASEAIEENKKKFSFKLDYVIYILAGISILCLLFPIIEFNYYPKENSLYDYKYYLDNNIDLRHKLNIFKLIFGYKVGNGEDIYDTIKFNPINMLLIILPSLVCVFKKKKFSIIFIALDIIILVCTRFLFLKQGMTGFDQGFGYEIIYSFGFFINFIILIIFGVFDFYYLFGSEKKNGNNL